ncbi:MAG: helix-turn-helix domain-containing protein [Firmicutes bacterium]|nr:helix-turn-helix domain-containing protein [Bacillota bacterium]
MHFKERLRELRLDSGLTQAKLAEKLSVTDTTIRHWEAGRSQPSIQLLVILSDLFDVTLDYLVGKTNSLPLSEPK